MSRQSADEIFDDAQEQHAAGRVAEAVELYQQSLQLCPDDAECAYFLGLALGQLGRVGDAAISFRRAIAIDVEVPEYHGSLAEVLFVLNDLPGAITAARNAVQRRADFPEALFVLANALCRSGQLDEGIEDYQQVLVLRPGAADALNNLGMALLTLGRVDRAIECFDQMLLSNPADAAAHSNRIYAMHFSPTFTPSDIRAEVIAWNQRHAWPLKADAIPHAQRHSTDGRLRIGYVSADFREHVVGWNMLSWLPEHDPKRFAIYCYSSVGTSDAVTRQLQSYAHVWRNIGASDAQAARLIRDDQIDILVDLSLHTSGNRLLVFARKPAPIQVTYLGYPGSTGLKTIDYRLSDPFLGSDQHRVEHTERTICLPQTYWCYRPGGPTPDVMPPPIAAAGWITFGCLNQFQKVSSPTLDLWQGILQLIPDSRLLLHAPSGKHRQELIRRFAATGVASHRIEFIERRAWLTYIQTYQRIDIALDPFPYGGGITTCDALWMGVPVITLCGKTSVGRGGTSILRNINLLQCIAKSPEDYTSAAIKLAADVACLADLRASLRARMLNSPLMNGRQFARDIERAFLTMWRQNRPFT